MEINELSCKDLMVGDWVRIKSTQRDTKVTNIAANNVYTETVFPCRYGEIEPIPLTPEILEKNGFYYGYTSREEDAANNTITSLSETDKGWCWDEGGGAIKVIFPNEADGGLVELDDQSFNRYLSFVFCDNLYFHELQHTLKLCGIEKEIIL